ncbi:hypothetical protein ACQEU8_24920 [Streptomyces sp. CA-250714]|uniref:hypothetical protein n=1 Tax=Streptomyces sp. CA-250714 TaxID=3240060 RepID=UPI003D93C46E
MNDRLTMALAVAGGYLLGRTRKAKFAVAVTLVSAGALLVQLARNPQAAERLLVTVARKLGQAAGRLDSVAGNVPEAAYEEEPGDEEDPGPEGESGPDDEPRSEDEPAPEDESAPEDAYAAAGERS